MAILNREMKPGVKCYVEGFVEDGADRFYVQSNGLVVNDPSDSDTCAVVYLERGRGGSPEKVTALIENCYWISQKTELSVWLPE